MTLLSLIIISCSLSTLFFPIIIKLANRFGFVDDPQKHKHPAILHKKTLPRAGGVAPFLAIAITTLLFLPIEKHLTGLLLASLIVLTIDTLDDKYDLHPIVRLCAGFLAASVVVISGVGISSIEIPLLGNLNLNAINIPINFLGEHHFFPLADISAAIWIVGLMNFLNWSSGIDGQLPTVSIIAFAFIAILASQFTSYDPSQWTIIKICLIAIGSIIPLLILNWHPAKILPGDGASSLLGIIIATLAIFSGSKTATTILVLGIPFIDGIWTIGRRIYSGKLPIWGDREHLHHKLLDIGWSPPKISIFYGFITFTLGIIAIYSSKGTKAGILFLTGLLIIFLTLSLGQALKNQKKTH